MTADEAFEGAAGRWLESVKDIDFDLVEATQVAFDGGGAVPGHLQPLFRLAAALVEAWEVETTGRLGDWQVGLLLMMKLIIATDRLCQEHYGCASGSTA